MDVLLLKQQYYLLKGSREVLFAYCENIAPEHFNFQHQGFGHGSIRNLLIHVANSYIHWLPNYALGSSVPYHNDTDIHSMADIYLVYQQTDQFVDDFLDNFTDRLYSSITNKLPNRNFNLTTTPLNLFTHMLTHEAHHKGQIISMSRHLGYTPPDTDLIRF